MRKPRTGWPRYHSPDELHLGWLASVFIVWGIIGLLTSWYYNNFLDIKTYKFNPAISYSSPEEPESAFFNGPMPSSVIEDMAAQGEAKNEQALIGPINVKKRREVYEISIVASLPAQSWSFIEGEVLDQDKEYLFSFGKELWYETGRDADGAWSENKNHYSIRVTFPQPGTYYLNFKTDSNKMPQNGVVKVTRKRGSALPHFWFGIIALVTGIVLNEIRNRTLIKIAGELSDD